MSQKNLRRLKRCVSCVVAVGALTALGWMVMPRERLLSRDGALVNDHWDAAYWQWRSPHEIVYLRNEAVPPSAEPHYAAYALNTGTGHTSALRSLNLPLHTGHKRDTTFYDPLAAIMEMNGWMELSPDGSSLLLVPDLSEPLPLDARFTTCDLNTEKVVQGLLTWTARDWERPYTLDPPAVQWAWMPDSRQWAALAPSKDAFHVLIYSAERPGLVTDLPLNVPKRQTDKRMVYPATCLGFQQDGRLLAAYWNPGCTDQMDLCVIDLHAGDGPANAYTISLPVPPDAEIVEMALSPPGDRIAWEFRCKRSSPLERLPHWLRRFLRSDFCPLRQDELWVSSVDGSNMQKVGADDAGLCIASDRPFWFDGIQMLHWTPDGQRLSYVIQQKLYTVPASCQ